MIYYFIIILFFITRAGPVKKNKAGYGTHDLFAVEHPAGNTVHSR